MKTSNKQTGFVYMMFDSIKNNKPPVYIGRTDCIKKRLKQHFTNLQNGKMDVGVYDSIELIAYADCGSHNNSVVAERILVANINPNKNTQMIKGGRVTIGIDDLSNIKWNYIFGEELEEIKNIKEDKTFNKELRLRVISDNSVDKLLKDCIMVAETGYSLIFHKLNSDMKYELIYAATVNDIPPDNLPYVTHQRRMEIAEEVKKRHIPFVMDYLVFSARDILYNDMNMDWLLNHPEYDVRFTYPEFREETRKEVKNFIGGLQMG